jgi:hypothetical protein
MFTEANWRTVSNYNIYNNNLIGMAKAMKQEISRSQQYLDIERTATKILGVTGSILENSHSTRTLAILLEIAANKFRAEVHLLNLRETKLPFYNPSITATDLFYENIKKVSQAVNWADAFVLASPDYHGSMSGTMKNFWTTSGKNLQVRRSAIFVHHMRRA